MVKDQKKKKINIKKADKPLWVNSSYILTGILFTLYRYNFYLNTLKQLSCIVVKDIALYVLLVLLPLNIKDKGI